MSIDAIALAQALIRRPSVTPADAGAMDLIEAALTELGFTCRRLRFGDIENLYARRGTKSPNLCFAGHTDVVPPGDLSDWRDPPFEARVVEGLLYGRGAADMKGAIAAFVAAVGAAPRSDGSISLLITGDEEGDAVDGTGRVVETLLAEGEEISHCVLGEPSSAAVLGDQMKIGRRGSLNAWIAIEGQQGHVAYPDRSANPIRPLIALLERLQARVLDEGYAGFPPSNLEITTVDVGNPATNVVPARAQARLNIRFNPAHNGRGLVGWLQAECDRAGEGFAGRIELTTRLTGEPFLTEPGDFVEVCTQALQETLGREPELSTAGGISDARFIRALCPVVEVGLVGATMHAVDECVSVADVHALTDVYRRLIELYFAAFAQ